jgi:hypothetical protein
MHSKERRLTLVSSRTRPQLTNVQLGTEGLKLIERRGARAHRGGSAFSRSSALLRQLRLLEALLEDADPRPRLARRVYETAIAALRRGWNLKPLEIRHLDEVLARAQGLEEALAAARLERREFLDSIKALSFAEKCALVDLAVQAHAPSTPVDDEQPA